MPRLEQPSRPGSGTAKVFTTTPLSYRAPFHWQALLAFFSKRAIPQCEAVDGETYFRTVHLERRGRACVGHIEVRNDRDQQRLLVRMSDTLRPVSSIVLDRLKLVFDLDADPAVIERTLGPLARNHPGLRLPGCFDGFETAVRAILGQQISVAAARTFTGRLVAKFGAAVASPIPSLTRLFPTPKRMAEATTDNIGRLGIIRQRARTLIALAQAMAHGDLVLEPGRDVAETTAKLLEIPGIGVWTAQYIIMRALSWPDAFLHTDLGVRKVLGETDPKRILALAEKWKPWRAYAVLHLWTRAEKPEDTVN